MRILHNLPRAGGTVVSRCLGCMDGVCLLSEIHPKSHFIGPVEQYNFWHSYDFVNEIPKTGNFWFDLKEIERKEKHRQIVIRAWDHADFIGYPFCIATGKMVMVGDNQIALVRDFKKQYESFCKNIASIPENMFRRCYNAYMDVVKGMSIIHFEDFLENPEKELQKICNILGVAYDWSWKYKWFSYKKITGDIINLKKTEINS